MSAPSLEELRVGGKPAIARALSVLERAPGSASTLALLDAAWTQQRGHALGITGPPGVGKSTLVSALIAATRGAGRTVAVIAVDPTSRRTGGALLGDRTRFAVDPDDPGVFVRSLAARERLGGTAALAAPILVLFRALVDLVIVETVGVGQSETGIRELTDTVLLAVQPASGDMLQFMKAGILEVPDMAVVTKADLGALADRTLRELEAAMRLISEAPVPVLAVAAREGEGIEALLAAIRTQVTTLGAVDLSGRRQRQADAWVREAVLEAWGSRGLRLRQEAIEGSRGQSPFRRIAALLAAEHDEAAGAPA